MYKGLIANQGEHSPVCIRQAAAEDPLRRSRTSGHSTDIIEQANRETTVNIVRSMLANPTDFIRQFTGNIDLATFKPLMEQYIASIPVGASVPLRGQGRLRTREGHQHHC